MYDARRDDEDPGDRTERELEARIEDERRVPSEQDERAEQERVPAIALPRRQPRERPERDGDGRTHDGGMESDREHVGADGGERCEMPEDTPAKERDCPGGNGRHLQTVDGEAVVETRRAKAVEECPVESARLPEDDGVDHFATLSAEPERRVACEPALQPVAHAGDAAAPADAARLLHVQDDVDALSAKPTGLRAARSSEEADDRESRALARRVVRCELQEDGLVDAKRVPAPDEPEHAHAEGIDPRRLLGLDERTPAFADVRQEHAVPEAMQPAAAPPPAGRSEYAWSASACDDRKCRRR